MTARVRHFRLFRSRGFGLAGLAVLLLTTSGAVPGGRAEGGLTSEATEVATDVATPVPARTPRLTVTRLQYDGDDWYANPSSLPNLIRAVRERTTLAVEPREARTTLLDEALFDHPFLHMTGHGAVRFSEAEVVRLREYLLR